MTINQSWGFGSMVLPLLNETSRLRTAKKQTWKRAAVLGRWPSGESLPGQPASLSQRNPSLDSITLPITSYSEVDK